MAAKDIRTRTRVCKSGRNTGGIHFKTGTLTHLLQNPIYVGKVRHKDKIYDGVHEFIISNELFECVQSIFAENRYDNALGKKSRNPSLLTGIISDPDGKPMTPTHAMKGSKRYRYYVTRTPPRDKSLKWRLPAGEIERLVIDTIARQLLTCSYSGIDNAREMEVQIDLDRQTSIDLPAMSIAEQRSLLLRYKTQVSVNSETIDTQFTPRDRGQPIKLSIEAKLVNRGSDVRLAIAPNDGPIKRDPDPVLLRLIAHAFAAQDLLIRGIPSPMVNHYKRRHLQQLVRLSFMAPDIISAIVGGTQPPDLTGRKIMRINKIPLDWAGQRKMFGVPAA